MHDIPRCFRVRRITFPSSGERYVLLEGPPHGLALDGTSLYTSMCLREAGKSPNTMAQHLAAIAVFLDWAAGQGIDPDQRILSLALFSRDEITGLRRMLRDNRDRRTAGTLYGTVGASHFAFRCHAVRDYVAWHAERAIDRIRNADVLRQQQARIALDDFRKRMSEHLPVRRQSDREGVSREVQELFLAAIRPEDPANPFKPAYRSRNHALLLLYHELGLRRGEGLKLKGEDLDLHGPRPVVRIVLRQDDPEDPRRNEPRLKTEQRDLPIGPALVEALRAWVTRDRPKIPGSRRSPYVFLSRSGAPLAENTVNLLYATLRTRVPGLPADFTTHVARHTANDRFGEVAKALGWSEDEERQARNYQFGWTKTSRQGDGYSKRRIREKAREASLRMQQASVKREDSE